ncbi:unnamed protein product [Zymoseptoria tritici ST99CH_1E4]|uniref:C2H2-type domain-containing protein n=1 Tax=Zymoseptoria tritici ST99CH_1E4 TaxID=1276532 RepID=A0A2H1GNG4_ZYMTR|nr:unnamed protein product [Zymoseptoria tritici ST99CH_1E4]
MDSDFDSSDIEIPSIAKNPAWEKDGARSNALLISTAKEDRVTSKIAVKQLTFHYGAPTTQRTQNRWIQRFETFRRHTLKQSLDTPFDGDDLIRFYDSILNQKLTNIAGKPGPNDDLVWLSSTYLIQYGKFKWPRDPEFRWTTGDHQRLKSFVSECVNNKRLTAGHWKSRTWLGFVTQSRMVRAYLDGVHQKGTCSVDNIVSRTFSIVFIAALGCRSGDVVQSPGCDSTQVMKFGHISLYLVGNDELTTPGPNDNSVTLANVRATVTIHYAKGLKNRRDDVLVKHLAPLLDPSSLHMCAISWMLIHTLRHGLVEGGTTLQQVLDHAAMRPDKRIMWTHPDRPVIPAFGGQGYDRAHNPCQLDTPAQAKQVLYSIQAMGKAAGILDRVYFHATRAGGARDASQLKNQPGAPNLTFNRESLGGLLGHNAGTRSANTTIRYVGDTPMDVYGARAAAKIVHLREPAIALEPEKVLARLRARHTTDERALAAGMDLVLPPGAPLSRSAVNYRVNKLRLDDVQKTATREPRRHALATRDANIPSPLPPAIKASPTPPTRPVKRSSSEVIADDSEELDENSVRLSRVIFPGEVTGNDDSAAMDAVQGTVHPSFGDMANIDPSLLDPSQLDPAHEAEVAQMMLGPEEDDQHSPGPSTPIDLAHQYVDSYARYNVVLSRDFWLAWPKYNSNEPGSFERTIGPCSTSGNSRDAPTPFIFRCRHATHGCEYSTLTKSHLERHEEACTSEKAEARLDAVHTGSVLQCQDKDCSYVARSKTADACKNLLAKHTKDVHDWEKKSCEHGCNPEKLFLTYGAYKQHQTKWHSGRWPHPCKFLGCEREKPFNGMSELCHHLARDHNVHGKDQNSYYPPKISKPKFVPQPCLLPEDCTTGTEVFAAPRFLVAHLKSEHNMDDAQAKELVKNKAKKSVVEKSSEKSSAFVVDSDVDEEPGPPAAKRQRKKVSKKSSEYVVDSDVDEEPGPPLARKNGTKKGTKKRGSA